MTDDVWDRKIVVLRSTPRRRSLGSMDPEPTAPSHLSPRAARRRSMIRSVADPTSRLVAAACAVVWQRYKPHPPAPSQRRRVRSRVSVSTTPPTVSHAPKSCPATRTSCPTTRSPSPAASEAAGTRRSTSRPISASPAASTSRKVANLPRKPQRRACGTFTTTYKFQAKFAADGTQSRGTLRAPDRRRGSGTGGFDGVTGTTRLQRRGHRRPPTYVYRGTHQRSLTKPTRTLIRRGNSHRDHSACRVRREKSVTPKRPDDQARAVV